MITFPILRTRRLTVQLEELSIAQTARIAALNASADQAEYTAFLRAAVKSVAQGPADPADWTIEERTLVVCHYLSGASEEGPDFTIGSGRYSDYLDGTKDISSLDPIELGECAGDAWLLRSITGRYAECIERLVGEVKDEAGEVLPARLHWIVGAMAASLLRKGEEGVPAQDATDGAIEEWMMLRMQVFSALPETEFLNLLSLFADGRSRIEHFFRLAFREEGVVYLPKEGAALPPARFPAALCISDFARGLV